MNKFFTRIAKTILSIALIASFGSVITSCESVYDSEGDCAPHYYLRFVFDMNMEFADAFNEQVKSVDVYVFEYVEDGNSKSTGKLVKHISDSGESLADDGYMLPLDLEPGKNYSVVAWCGLENNRHFTLRGNIDKMNDASVTLSRAVSAEGATSNELLDELFHGITDIYVPTEKQVQFYFHPESYPEEVGEADWTVPVHPKRYGGTETVYAPEYRWDELKQQFEVIYTVSLIRDTNNVTLTLAHQTGQFNLDQLRIEMADNNGAMNFDNSLDESDQSITFTPWRIESGTLDASRITTKDFSFDDPIVDSHYANFLTSETSTARMTTGHEKTLRIYYKDTNQTIFQIPLTRWVTQMRSAKYRNMSDQEYLDRENQYDLLVFLQDDGRGGWKAVQVVINGWHIIENGEEVL